MPQIQDKKQKTETDLYKIQILSSDLDIKIHVINIIPKIQRQEERFQKRNGNHKKVSNGNYRIEKYHWNYILIDSFKSKLDKT